MRAFVITHGRDGLIFPSRDSRALADAMARLMDHPELRRTLGEQAKDTFQHRFTGQVFARNTEEVYRTILKGAK